MPNKLKNLKKYEVGGNFNYGAVGAALGISLGTLQRAAGYVAHIGDGGDKASFLGVLLGTGGSPPYGDQIVDQDNIKKGFDYYDRKYVKQDCW